MRSVPTLVVDSVPLTQSLAIIEYLEDTHPANPLLPHDPVLRAKARAISLAIVADIQPVQNLKVLNRLDEAKRAEWARYFIESGFKGSSPRRVTGLLHGALCPAARDMRSSRRRGADAA